MGNWLNKLRRASRVCDHRSAATSPLATGTTQPTADTAAALDTTPEAVQTSRTDEPPHSRRLENLPPEIRRYLLSTLDLGELRSVVGASRAFHQQYRHDRTYILRESLETTLGTACADAYAVFVSRPLRRETNEDALHVLRTRQVPLHQLEQSTLEQMSAFYFRYVSPTLDAFSMHVLHNLDLVVAGPGGDANYSVQQRSGLSATERLRFLRAIYHFELLSRIANPLNPDLWQGNAPQVQRKQVEELLGTIQPWEVERLHTLYQFAEKKYESVFEEIKWDLHPDNPRFEDQERPPTPVGSFDLDDVYSSRSFREGVVLCGLPLLCTVSFDIKDHEDLVQTMQKHLVSSYIPLSTMMGMLGEDFQTERYQNHPSGKDRSQATRQALMFQGDSVAVGAPPLAWTYLWRDTYSSLYGYFLSDDIRSWGYVFWDAGRLEEVKGKEMLEQERDEFWEGQDPRDVLDIDE